MLPTNKYATILLLLEFELFSSFVEDPEIRKECQYPDNLQKCKHLHLMCLNKFFQIFREAADAGSFQLLSHLGVLYPTRSALTSRGQEYTRMLMDIFKHFDHFDSIRLSRDAI